MDRRIRLSRAQEARGAAQHGGRVQPGSGSGRYAKGDVKTPFLLIEYKMTQGKTIRIDSADLIKHRERALVEQKVPLFGIEVGGRDYIIAAQDDIEYLIERRARELAGIQRGLGDAGSAESGISQGETAEVRRRGESRKRAVLPGAAPLSTGRARSSDDAAGHGGTVEGLLPRTQISRRSRVPRAPRVSRLGDGELATVRDLGRRERTGAQENPGSDARTGRISRIIGGG